jgi:hypothetical protein
MKEKVRSIFFIFVFFKKKNNLLGYLQQLSCSSCFISSAFNDTLSSGCTDCCSFDDDGVQ